MKYLKVLLFVFLHFIGLFFLTNFFSFYVFAEFDSTSNTQSNDQNDTTQNKQVQQSETKVKKEKDDIKSFGETLQVILKVLTILLWPFLALSGWALSNDFVTGKIFHIDGALWQFWQIMRTFSNYLLGFVFIFSILGYLLYNGERFHPKKIIPKILIATVLVQMSWFLIGALLDLSTILTVSFGAMPLNILGKNGEKLTVYQPITYISASDLGEKGQKLSINFVNFYLLSSDSSSDLVVGCLLSGGKIIDQKTRNLFINKINNIVSNYKNSLKINGHVSNTYCMRGNKILELNNCFTKEPKDCKVAKDIQIENKSLSSIIKSLQNMTGPLYFLYGSILQYNSLQEYVVGGNVGYMTISLEMIIRVLVGIILFLPLVALAVVLVMRGFILWFIIAFSPLIILMWIFDFLKIGKDSGKFSVSNILGLIFMPVTVTFALSIGIIFLSILAGLIKPPSENHNNNNISNKDTLSKLGIILNEKEINVGSGQKKDATCLNILNNNVCIIKPDTQLGNFANRIDWLFVNIIGGIIVWTLIFAALKTSSFTASIVGTIESIGKGLATSAPIIPTPWGAQSLGSLKYVADRASNIPGTIAANQYEKSSLNNFFERMSSEFSGSVKEYKKLLESSKDFKTLNERLHNLPKGFSTADFWNIIKEKLQKFAPENLKNKIGKINKIEELGSYPEVVRWLKENGMDVDDIFYGGDSKYQQNKMEQLKKEFFKKLYKKYSSADNVYKVSNDDLKMFAAVDKSLNIGIVVGFFDKVNGEVNPEDSNIYNLNNKDEFIKFIDKVTLLKMKKDKNGKNVIKDKDVVKEIFGNSDIINIGGKKYKVEYDGKGKIKDLKEINDKKDKEKK